MIKLNSISDKSIDNMYPWYGVIEWYSTSVFFLPQIISNFCPVMRKAVLIEYDSTKYLTSIPQDHQGHQKQEKAEKTATI